MPVLNKNPFEGTGIPSLLEMYVQGLVLRERWVGIQYPRNPTAIPSLPRDPRMQGVKSQNNRRDRKERAGWNYIAPGGSINKSSQRNQSQEENGGLAQL